MDQNYYMPKLSALKRTGITLCLVFLPLLTIKTQAQTISTVAGNGSCCYTTDGVPATSTPINYPWSVAPDAYGNFFIGGWWSGSGYARVREVNSSGIITTYAGTGTSGFSGDGGPATAAQIYYGGGVATDAAGNLYISDYGNWRIRKVNKATGIITTIAGTGTPGYTGDGGPATAAQIYNWWWNSITVDAIGNVYFYNWAYYRVRKIDTFGIITTVGGNGTYGYSGDGGPATSAAMGYLYGMTTDASGNVYLADWAFRRVRKITVSTGIITTYAGNGGAGFSGDGGPATAAQVGPLGVAMDGAGNLNIADYLNNRIRKVNSSGIITTIAGTGSYGFSGDGGPATAATFDYIYGVGVDPGGNVYISDYGNIRIRKITNYNRPPRFVSRPSANLVVCENTIGDSINSLLAVMDSDMFQPEMWSVIGLPSHGTAYVAYSMTSTGSIMNAHGTYYTPATGYSGPDTFLVQVNDGYAMDTIKIYVTVNPVPATITGSGSIAIGSYATLADATPGGTWSSSSSAIATIGGTTGIAIGTGSGTATITYTLPTGCILTTTLNVFPYAGTIITTIAGNGTAGTGGDGGQATAAQLRSPWGAAVDGAGNIYIVDEGNNKIRKVSPTGIISTFAGTGTAGFTGDGGAATAAQLNGPFDVIVDLAGNVYVADAGNNRVRKISAAGTITTYAGNGTTGYTGDGGPASAAGLPGPSGLAMDASGNVYICADGTHVRKVNSAGTISTFAGNGGTGFSGDGGPATAAQLHNPVSVTADGLGNVFIADQLNRYIRKVNTSGIISSIAGIGSSGYGGDGGPATTATLNDPWGIAADAAGNLYIGDHGNNRVRKINPSGVITTVAGNGTSGFAGDGCAATGSQINSHWGICVDGFGFVYVADGGNNRVRKIYSNRAPAFVGGHILTSSVCQNSTDSLNILLRALDVDNGQSETWSALTSPVHGTLAAGYSATSNGGTLTPAGLYYAPAIGYTGPDSFKVKVSDCGIGSDTTTVYITVTPPPSVISGSPAVCAGLTTLFTNPVTGGVWSSSATGIATIGSSTGVVTGISAGPATITYSPGAGCSVTRGITVNAAPAAIAGNHNICMGVPVTFTDATGGGLWISSNPSAATIGSVSGIVNGVAAGTTTITYMQSGCPATFDVTVNPLVPGITGVPSVCAGAPTALFGSGAGVWSSTGTGIATVDSFTGIVTGVSAGSTTVSFTQPTGCAATIPVDVYALPLPVSGPVSVCAGQTITLSDPTSSGFWSMAPLSMSATVDSVSGVVLGVSSGTATIDYTVVGVIACATTYDVSVNPTPAPITGITTVCVGATTSLFDPGGGGVWSSSTPGIATIGTGTGVVTGISGVTGGSISTISYTAGGCSATVVVTVNPAPGPIGGASTVCVGLSTTLTDATGGGTWSSSAASIATTGSATGLLTGVFPGTAVITYTTSSGCTATKTITVNNTPGLITGNLGPCVGTVVILSNIVGGGTWSSSSPAVATIGSTSGSVSALTPGTTTITYALGAGCSATAILTVNALPPAITGALNVCVGSTTTLSDGSPGGTWTASGTSATVGAFSGIVTGGSTGTSPVTYTLPTGCSRSVTVTVNPLPGVISGPSTVCPGAAITLSSAPAGGTWSSATTTVATTGSATGIVTGGTPGTTVITYTLGTGCTRTKTITVNTLPAAITGANNVCEAGGTILLGDITPGGTWSSSSTTTGSVSGTGTVTGVTAGTVTISYTVGSTGCTATKTITVNPLPSAISGPTAVCVGSAITATSGPAGGVWVSGTTSVAIIGSSTGVVTGVATGPTAITYTLPTGCATTSTVTVSLSPVAISGAATVCAGLTTPLTDAVPGGAWSSSNPATGSIGSLSGIVTGLIPGPTTITYSLGTGCTVTKSITVTASPAAITGALNICNGATTTLGDGTPGGVWSSSGMATVNSTSGLVTGTGVGTAAISYTSGGCAAIATVTVNPAPTVISGPTAVCIGMTATETNGTPGGLWYSTSSIVTIGSSSGIVSGLSSGTATITYSVGSCTTMRTMSVNAISPISGATGVCVGLTTTLSCPGGGTWVSGTTGVATIGSTSGIVTGMSVGSSVITYTLGTGCITTTTVNVNTAPTAIGGTLHVCAGSTTTLTNGSTGGAWSSGSPSVATVGSSTGIVSGATPGTTTITYSLGSGCTATAIVTVQTTPAAITGTMQVCQGNTTALADATGGGTWSSSSSNATVGATTGTVTGVAVGTAMISYTLSTGCQAAATVTVNPLPSAISGTLQVCVGLTTTLSDAVTGGTWTSSNPTIAGIGSASVPMAIGITGGTPGIAIITYSLGAGCNATANVTVNAAPVAIAGSMQVCIGSTTTLSDASPGGTWSSTSTPVATITGAGVVTGWSTGTSLISYTAGGCPATATVTVNALPSAITGTPNVCAGGGTTTLSDATTGGTWSSSNTLVATVGTGTGIVSGTGPGTVTISYSMGAGCTVSMPVVVNPVPSSITGSPNICIGAVTLLSDITPGGVWSSSNSSVATIGTGGNVTGVTGGVATISYALPSTGCAATFAVNVTIVPPITGLTDMCAWGDTLTVHDSNPGGSYSSTLVTVTNLGGGGGRVTAFAPGIGTVTYTLVSGCSITATVNTNPLPGPISGNQRLCTGQTSILIDTAAGGTWSSSNTAVATISGTGLVTSLTPGITHIRYTFGTTGCMADTIVTVLEMPSPIAGTAEVCAGATTTLTDTASGGVWTSSSTGIATAGAGTGLITGVSAGTATITYSMAPACRVTRMVTVDPLPTVFTVTGGGNYCAGSAGADIGLSGSQSGVSYQLYHGATAIGSTVTGTGAALDLGMQTLAGTYTITASNTTTGCGSNMSGSVSISITATVNPAVTIVVLPNDTVCTGTNVSFTATPANGGSSPLYQWTVNGTNTATTSIYSYVPANGDVVSVLLTSNAVCAAPATATRSVTMKVTDPVVPVVTITANPGTTIKTGTADTFTATVTGGGLSPQYQWEVNSVPVVSATSPTYITSTLVNGDTVKCIVTNTDQCALSAYKSLIVTVNSGVGVKTITGEAVINVLPNPNKGVFTIKGTLETTQDEEIGIEITDMLGQVVYRGSTQARGGRVNEQVTLGSNIANGMYMLNLRTATGNKVFHMVVEQ